MKHALGVVRVIGFAVLCCAWAPSYGQQAAATKPCSGPEFRQFDFWLGYWQVSAGGKPAGHNRIEKRFGDCVIHEQWQSESGPFRGASYNIYDQAGGRWHQTWVDNSGRLLLLDGAWQDDRMILTGTRPSKDGKQMVLHRISWIPMGPGQVRQIWEAKGADDMWKTLFDGHYKRVTE